MTPSLSDFENQMTLNSEEEHAKLVFQLKTRCIQTDQWNPLIFAIYYGSMDIVKYLVKQITDSDQPIQQLLCDSFKCNPDGQEEEEGSEFMIERSYLAPVILPIITKNVAMFTYIWEELGLRGMWKKPIFLILLGNFIFETQLPELIRKFLLSKKTLRLFSYMSQCEKQKFVQFVIVSLEQQIVEEEENSINDNLDDMNDIEK